MSNIGDSEFFTCHVCGLREKIGQSSNNPILQARICEACAEVAKVWARLNKDYFKESLIEFLNSIKELKTHS